MIRKQIESGFNVSLSIQLATKSQVLLTGSDIPNGLAGMFLKQSFCVFQSLFVVLQRPLNVVSARQKLKVLFIFLGCCFEDLDAGLKIVRLQVLLQKFSLV